MADDKEKITGRLLMKIGGTWLAAARTYVQWHAINGGTVKWGSGESVNLTMLQIEELSADVAAKAVNDYKDGKLGV